MKKQVFPEPTVGAVLLNPRGEVLLVKSHKWGDKYTIPGGHVELGESMENALKREIKEETGLKIYDLRFIQVADFIFDKEFWKKRHFIFIDFACRTRSTKVRLNSEGQQFAWVPLKEVSKMSVEPYAKRSIERFAKMRG